MVLSMFSFAIVLACALTCARHGGGIRHGSSLRLRTRPRRTGTRRVAVAEPGRGGRRPRSRRRGGRPSRGRRPRCPCSPRSAEGPPAERSPAATAPPSACPAPTRSGPSLPSVPPLPGESAEGLRSFSWDVVSACEEAAVVEALL